MGFVKQWHTHDLFTAVGMHARKQAHHFLTLSISWLV